MWSGKRETREGEGKAAVVVGAVWAAATDVEGGSRDGGRGKMGLGLVEEGSQLLWGGPRGRGVGAR